MKCSNTQCGVVGISNFCPQCGSEMMETETLILSIVCGGKKKDGSVCEAEIGPSQKFCTKCGTKVDKSRFEDQQNKCIKCGSAIEQEIPFCGECGFEQDGTVHEELTVTKNITDGDNAGGNITAEDQRLNEGDVGGVDNGSVPELVDDDREMVEHGKNVQLKIADASDVNKPEMTLLEESIPGKGDNTPADSVSNKEMITVNVTDISSSGMSCVEGNQLLAESDESKMIQQKKKNKEKRKQDRKEKELNADTTQTTSDLKSDTRDSCRDDTNLMSDVDERKPLDSFNIAACELTNGDGQVQRSCKEDSQKHADTQKDCKILKEDDNEISEERETSGILYGKPMIKQIIKDSIKANERSTDFSNSTGTELQTPMSTNDATSTYEEEIQTAIPSEELSDEEYESFTESESDLSQSKDDMPNNESTKALPMQTQYHGKYKRKQKGKNKRKQTNTMKDGKILRENESEPNDILYGKPTIKPQQILEDSLKANESSTDFSNSTGTELQSPVSTNDVTHTNEEEIQTASPSEEVSDEESDPSQSDDDLPDNKSAKAVRMPTKYHGKYKRKQKGKHRKRKNKIRRKKEREASRVVAKSEENTDVNGNTPSSQQPKSNQSAAHSGGNGMVFGSEKDRKNKQNKSNKGSTQTKVKLFETKITESRTSSSSTKQSKEADKPKQKPSDVNKANNQNKTSVVQDSTSKQSSPHTKVQVYFHGLIGNEFNFDFGTHKLILRINDDWANKTRVCTVERNEEILEFKCLAQFPVSMERIEYKYCILKPDGKYVWEYYSSWIGNCNREMLSAWKVSDVWNQYDGVIRRQKGFLQKVSDFFLVPDMVHQAKLCAKYFSTRIIQGEDKLPCYDNVLEQLKALFVCLRKIYFHDARSWGHSEESVFVRQVGFCVLGPLLDKIAAPDMDDGAAWSNTHELKVRAAITVILLVHETGKLNIHQTNVWNNICNVLQIRPNANARICHELRVVEIYFPQKKKQVLEAFQTLVCSIARSTTDPSWLFLMPWIHFLSGWCTPFQDPPFNVCHDSYEPLWWGLNLQLNEAVTYFMGKSSNWKIPMEDILKRLEPLFLADYLLPRTFLAAVSLQNIFTVIKHGTIPAEVYLANSIYFLRTKGVYNKEVQNYIGTVSGIVQEVRTCYTVVQRKLQCLISDQLVNECTQCNQETLFVCGLRTLLHCLSQYDLHSTDTADDRKQFVMSILQPQVDNAVYWLQLRKPFNTTINLGHFQMWNSLFIVTDGSSKNVMNVWNSHISNALKNKLQMFYREYSFIGTEIMQLCFEAYDSYCTIMQECLSTTAFQVLVNGTSVSYEKFSVEALNRIKHLLSDLFIKEWTQRENTFKSESEMLHHFLQWPIFMLFLKTYKRDDFLTQDCLVNLTKVVSVVQMYTSSLLSGAITVEKLTSIQQTHNSFPEAASLVPIGDTFTSEYIVKAIAVRQKEVDAFNAQLHVVTRLANLCEHLENVDQTPVDEVLDNAHDINTFRICDICLPAKISDVENYDNFQPRVSAFQLSDSVFDMLPHLSACYESTIFMKMWEKRCRSQSNECFTFDEVEEKVWRHVKQKWESLSDDIRSGSIKFSEFEKFFGRQYDENYEYLTREIQILGLSAEIIESRVGQLQQYRQLENCVHGAQTIIRFARQYKLTGDFKKIQAIAEHMEHDLEMRYFDQSIMKTCQILKDISKDKEECLATFLNCHPLIDWLKTTMKMGLKELKVFVDLAFMSVGEVPIQIAQVQCFHSSVTGYAPLIFDLKRSCDYKQLLELCQNVWNELQSNPRLPQQLKDTTGKLEWLKEIQKSLGSVELTSLMQADAINSAGIYQVGRHAFRTDPLHMSQLDVQNIVRLTVTEGRETKQNRNYTVSQLQDLQSRLMLVAGKSGKQQDEKGNDAVERFTMIFDSITRLAKVFLQLRLSGCVLFNDFTATFFCHPTRQVCAVLEFGNNEKAPHLKGRLLDEEDIKDLIPVLASFLDKCLKEWLHNIKEKRQSYPHLNYFTVDQLVILQKELVKLGTEYEPSCWIYPLLSAVKLDCTQDDLLQARKAAKEEIESEGLDDETANEDLAPDAVDADAIEDNLKQTFITELVEAGFEHNLAVRALQHVDPNDVNEGISWCMKNDTAVSGADNDINETEQKPVVDKWSQSTTDIQSSINTSLLDVKKRKDHTRNRGIAFLMEYLQEFWMQFLVSITSNISDFINLEHLGIILKHLAATDTRQLSRSLLPGLQEGQPNLILCPCDDVLLTTMSMYLNEKDQPLPQSDEVLLCTSDTTKDEVDIFLRRAIYDGSHKIHCLVNAECLNYDVSELAERCLEQYVQETRHEGVPFRLVVICGSENECRSTFISSLDKYKRPAVHVNMNTIRETLSRQLTVEHNADPVITPAAWVDRDHLSVRVVKSSRPGVGKTLYKQRREEELTQLNGQNGVVAVSIPLQESNVDMHYVTDRFLEHTIEPDEVSARLFHVDISHGVLHGVDNLLFNLLILGCLTDKTGWVWRKSPMDLYLIETWPLIDSTRQLEQEMHCVHRMLTILPDTMCRSPAESLHVYMTMKNKRKRDKIHDQLFDEQLFLSEVFQRPFQYLDHLEKGHPLDDVYNHTPLQPVDNPEACLQVLLRHCGVRDPSWLELHHFVWFLNTQLVDFEKSSFTSPAAAEHLPGFSTFVLRFLIQMSKDFATRSLNMSEESPGQQNVDVDDDDLAGAAEAENVEEADNENANIHDELKPYQIRRTWESSPHPYLFFNSDRSTFTFLGFYIDKATGNLIDTQTRTVLVERIIDKKLSKALYDNKVPLTENFDDLPRHEKIMKLCNVMGIDMPHDPDDSYELTTDNVKKILAIYMRFRCDIPVIIMGETGCGKTRLIKFLCALQVPPGANITNMVLMKVHGGTTKADIERTVRQADEQARKNANTVGQHLYTVLFFDEANTSEAIGLIKEIMCDKTLSGTKLQLCESLKIVAACNPYRKHSDELIKKLEQAGLGYHVDADETTDRLGRVPMRRLVYRVQPLPHSMLPLVWDFGQLNTQVEDLYIRQMVRRYIRQDDLPDIPGLIEVVSAVLTASQEFMRRCNNECSFVSLRDVDRVLSVMSWFYLQSRGHRTLYALMDEKLYGENETSSSEEEEEAFVIAPQIASVDDVTRSLILALGVCYHACLRSRPEYRAFITQYFGGPCRVPDGEDQIQSEIECCQDVFLEKLELDKNIARNMALTENVFMMVVCIELRIPLFLVGKPGSSKSLAKTIVSDAMQGNAARQDLFKQLKQAQMVSFQCSPLSTPDGIVGTFRQCAQFQKDKDLNNYVSVVVLDEVGLAEDSPRMPLKTLHPLLEDGCQGDETPEAHKKVAFIGISNWALDPAKMNRGILVQRDVPDLEELVRSARGICQVNKKVDRKMDLLIEPMAESYLELFDKASQQMREFFGLRDFYSLVKMVCGFVEKSKKHPTWFEMLHAIKRNFGGLDKVDSESCFRKHLAKVVPVQDKRKQTDPECSPDGLIRACLFDTNKLRSESRYLLLLTENYGALTIMQQIIRARSRDFRPITIFGSSFRCDQEYTQVCRNINKIKVCMETGNTVVLLNLENLYESLYDALNQYYIYYGGERYVDLGLGTHRVKCPVHKKFRLIVVAEKNTVYKKFPIPLINRLEKHFLSINTMLSADQLRMVEELKMWTERFCTRQNLQTVQSQRRGKDVKARVSETFIGYNDDTCSAVVLDVWENDVTNNADRYNKVFNDAKMVLLWCATPDSIANLKYAQLSAEEQAFLNDTYFKNQAHGSLIEYLQQKIVQENTELPLLSQITTHSKLMASVNKDEISQATRIPVDDILFLESLSSFDTEQQFSIRVRHFLQHAARRQGLMVIQCDSGDINANLVACARYCVMDELEKLREDLEAHINVVIIIQLPRQSTFSGFQCGSWHSVHIDDLYQEEENMPKMAQMIGRSVATLVNDVVSRGHLPSEDSDPKIETLSEMEEQARELTSIQTDMDESTGAIARFHGIIIQSVHAALAIVKDKEENTNRETDRVTLVLKLLHQSEDAVTTPFVHGVCCLLAKLLNEKESKTFNPRAARDWVIKEAATDESLNKTGTFRRSCLQTLQNKVTPILAGIIAFLDTNDNLKLLQDDTTGWRTGLWFEFLINHEALQLQYSDMQSLSGRNELPEVTIKTTGFENHIFCAQIPFSWIIIEKIQEILALPNPKVNDEDTKDDEESFSENEHVVNVLNNNPIGQMLNSFTDIETVSDIVKGYVHDFVHTVYHPASESELELVCQSIMFQTLQLAPEVTERTLIQRLVCVHEAHTILAQRLLYFREINKVWCECSSVIIEAKENEPDNFMFKDEEYTFSGLCLMIESLTPTAKDLNNARDRIVWLNKVHRFRPIVEKLIHLHQMNPDLYGAQSCQCIRRTITLWNRVLVVKLFLEHVCVSDKEERITIKYCMPLWKYLGDETNMKQLKSLKEVETFLKTCNRQARAQYLGAQVKCSQCENELEGAPLTLPCKDILCTQCYNEMRALGNNKCQKCRRTFVDGWVPLPDSSSKVAQDKLKDYQRRCNSFFMDVVSQLCFADNAAPSRDVVEHLLGYIFFTTRNGEQQCTRDISVFDTGIDPSPVFRSFLLQLLLKTSEDHVTEYLGCYLDLAKESVAQETNDGTEQILELNLLVIQCIENKLLQDCNRGDMGDKHEAQCALEALRDAVMYINSNELDVDKMYAVARARMGLSVAAKYIAYIIRNDIEPRQADPGMRRVIDAAWRLHDDSKLEWTRIYLVKYLCRRYGIDTYHRACKSTVPYMRWLALKNNDDEKVVEVSDRYIVCGESYTRIREVLTRVVLGENIDHLTNIVQELHTENDDDEGEGDNAVEILLGLAIHREISSSFLYPTQKRKLTPEIMESIRTFIEGCEQIENKEMFVNMMTNQLSPERLVIVEKEDQHLQGIQCLLVHYMLVMVVMDGGRTLLQPLQTLIQSPESCDEMYLPTMPQDDLETVKEALLNARTGSGNENPVFYQCPNGHLYVIGDCGRPGRVGLCRECGAAIGGERHRLLPGNFKNEGADNTVTGHILGTAEIRGPGPNPERMMTPSYCACVRLMLHLAMYTACGTDQESICSLIKPNIREHDLEKFLWDHIQLDIEDLHRALGRSTDDVLLLMHLVLNNMSTTLNNGGLVTEEICQLSSKKGREDWETRFCSSFLEPIFQNLDGLLKDHNQQLAQDKRLGADPLLCLLYETESDSSENTETTQIQDIARVWRYCTPISWQHLKQEVNTMTGTEHATHQPHKVLQLFIEEEYLLKALRFIPSIFRLHRALLHKYLRKIDKQEASQITVASITADAVAGGDTDMLLQDFCDAWDIVRGHLKSHVCYTKFGGFLVQEKYCTQRITPTTPVSMLLPTTRDAGLCSYAMLDFLMRKHNQFLDRYCKETHRKSSSMTSVSPREVTSAHLISYDPEHDILPLVLANCQYSFEMGKGTKIEYDFAGLERQLMDRFLLSKSRIDVGSALQIDQMVYRTELTGSETFYKLDEKIPQVLIEPTVKLHISEDLRSLPDICKTLDNVDIAISFLKSTGGKQGENLHHYMVNILQMNHDCNCSQTAKHVCEFKHCKALWLLLSLLKAKHMVIGQHHSKAIFETVSREFHEDLPEDMLSELQQYIQTLSVDNLSHLVEVIHEFILLKVAVRENTNDEDFIDSVEFKLGEYLYEYVDSMDNPPINVRILEDLPADILYKHCVQMWITAYIDLDKRQSVHNNE